MRARGKIKGRKPPPGDGEIPREMETLKIIAKKGTEK